MSHKHRKLTSKWFQQKDIYGHTYHIQTKVGGSQVWLNPEAMAPFVCFSCLSPSHSGCWLCLPGHSETAPAVSVLGPPSTMSRGRKKDASWTHSHKNEEASFPKVWRSFLWVSGSELEHAHPWPFLPRQFLGRECFSLPIPKLLTWQAYGMTLSFD